MLVWRSSPEVLPRWDPALAGVSFETSEFASEESWVVVAMLSPTDALLTSEDSLSATQVGNCLVRLASLMADDLSMLASASVVIAAEIVKLPPLGTTFDMACEEAVADLCSEFAHTG